MKTTIIGLLVLATANINAQEKAQTYQLADAPRYSEETGYGYDLVATPAKGSKAPLYSRSGEIYRFTLQFRPNDRIFACQHSVIPQKL